MTPSIVSNQATTEESCYRAAGSATSSRVAYFEYVGRRARVVTGESGQRYHFVGQRVLVGSRRAGSASLVAGARAERSFLDSELRWAWVAAVGTSQNPRVAVLRNDAASYVSPHIIVMAIAVDAR